MNTRQFARLQVGDIIKFNDNGRKPGLKLRVARYQVHSDIIVTRTLDGSFIDISSGNMFSETGISIENCDQIDLVGRSYLKAIGD